MTALAAKVYSAHATAEGVDKGFIRELDAFQCFLADDSDIFDLPCLKDHFYHTSPQGKHLCILMPVLCDSIDAWRKSRVKGVIDPQVVKEITVLVVEALAQMHKRGIIHTGLILPIGMYCLNKLRSIYRHQSRQHSD